MNAHDLLDAVNYIDDDLLNSLEEEPSRPARRPVRWHRVVATAACVALVLAAVPLASFLTGGEQPPVESTDFDGKGTGTTQGTTNQTVAVAMASTLAKATYPPMAPYALDESDQKAQQAWWDDVFALRQLGKDYATGLYDFYTATAGQFLTGEAGKNRVYSPLNLYMALSMLAETTDGDSRREILSLLGQRDMDSARAAAKGLWSANYRDDGVTTSLLANSLWLRQDAAYRQDTLDRLAADHYASVFAGQMGSDGYTQALRDWLNEQTGGLLKKQVDNVELYSSTVMALASTIHFKATWVDRFNKDGTTADLFHAATGDVTCEFMHQKDPMRAVYEAKDYKAVSLGLAGNYFSMWLVLPDKGVSLDTVIDRGVAEKIARWHRQPEEGADFGYYEVTMSVPKFDVAGEVKLQEGLQALGVTSVFDSGKADFSPLMENAQGLHLTDASHAARVKIDEDGCEAAAYTMALCGTGAPQIKGKLDFRLDRPFLFFITGTDGALLFAGAVENPLG